MTQLYTTEILRLAASIPRTERLEDPDFSVTKTSRICGSRITVDIKFKDGAIADYGQTVKACALGQASSSLVARHIIGATAESFLPVAEAVRKMIRGEGPAPEGDWSDFKIFAAAKDHKSRHGSILLPFEAISAAFQSLQPENSPSNASRTA